LKLEVFARSQAGDVLWWGFRAENTNQEHPARFESYV